MRRIVLDTNILVSRLLSAGSIPGQSVSKAIRNGRILVSKDTLLELATVLARPKLDRYVSIEARQQFLRLLGTNSELISIAQRVRACRDPKDDKFLELAVNGNADLIVTGDQDLLVLRQFRTIRISTPADYLAAQDEDEN